MLLVWFCFSFAGLPWVTVGPAALVLLVAGAIWVTRALAVLAGRAAPRPREQIIVALVLLVTVVGVASGLPLATRFALSEPAFGNFVGRAGPPPASLADDDLIERACPGRLGLYAIDRCEVTAGGYLFFDPLGNALVDHAGFAYLPDGPVLASNAGFELQELVHLSGPWYAFAASW